MGKLQNTKEFLYKRSQENKTKIFFHSQHDTSIIADTFKNYFINIRNTLNLKFSIPKSKPLYDLLKLYKGHFSILKIKEKYKIQNKFEFGEK